MAFTRLKSLYPSLNPDEKKYKKFFSRTISFHIVYKKNIVLETNAFILMPGDVPLYSIWVLLTFSYKRTVTVKERVSGRQWTKLTHSCQEPYFYCTFLCMKILRKKSKKVYSQDSTIQESKNFFFK